MIADDAGQRIHDKATRGLVLSAEERALLAEWYARMDEEESRQLSEALPSPTLAALQVVDRYRELLKVLQQHHRQQARMQEEQRAILEEQKALLELLLKEEA